MNRLALIVKRGAFRSSQAVDFLVDPFLVRLRFFLVWHLHICAILLVTGLSFLASADDKLDLARLNRCAVALQLGKPLHWPDQERQCQCT